MKNSKEDLSSNKREFIEFLEKASSLENTQNKKEENLAQKQGIHLNSLITKNISLFSKNPNYKMLAWLLTQLTIFSLFILAMTILKNNIVPYLNTL
tara:strand:- start:196 stop:483 length:288 start_codon:yes stop_codon:yes gene_type:complete